MGHTVVLALFTMSLASSTESAEVLPSPDAKVASEDLADPPAKSDDIDEAGTNWRPFHYYYSYWLDDDLDPDVRTSVFLVAVLSAFLPFGALWSPYLFEETADGMFADLLLSAIVHYGLMQLAFPAMFVCPPFGYMAWAAFSAATQFWLAPVTAANIYHRAYLRKKNGTPHPLDGETKDPKKKKKAREEERGEASRTVARPELAHAY